MASKRIKDLNMKLTKADKDKKSVEAALARAEKLAEDQHQQLHKTEDQVAISKKQIKVLKKLVNAEEVVERVEQEGYDVRVKEIKESLRALVTGVC